MAGQSRRGLFVFFLTGLLMGLVPAGSLGLSGPAFFSLRMCWMLLGPVYATLAARLILAFLPAAQSPARRRRKGTKLVLAVAALLLLADLSGADTPARYSSLFMSE